MLYLIYVIFFGFVKIRKPGIHLFFEINTTSFRLTMANSMCFVGSTRTGVIFV